MLLIVTILISILVPLLAINVVMLKVTTVAFRKRGLTWWTAVEIVLSSVALVVCSLIIVLFNPGDSRATIVQLLFILGAFIFPVMLIRQRLQVRTLVSIAIMVVATIAGSVVGFGYAAGLATYVVKVFQIRSGGMLPTISAGEYILANRLVYRFKTPTRGEIIVFRYPADTSKDFIQRVAAVGGDTVEIRDKKVFINGKPYLNDPGVNRNSEMLPAGATPRDNLLPVMVPQNSFFVLGDNRDTSFDSRYWGFVKSDHVIGRPSIICWSYDPTGERVRTERIGLRIR